MIVGQYAEYPGTHHIPFTSRAIGMASRWCRAGAIPKWHPDMGVQIPGTQEMTGFAKPWLGVAQSRGTTVQLHTEKLH